MWVRYETTLGNRIARALLFFGIYYFILRLFMRSWDLPFLKFCVNFLGWFLPIFILFEPAVDTLQHYLFKKWVIYKHTRNLFKMLHGFTKEAPQDTYEQPYTNPFEESAPKEEPQPKSKKQHKPLYLEDYSGLSREQEDQLLEVRNKLLTSPLDHFPLETLGGTCIGRASLDNGFFFIAVKSRFRKEVQKFAVMLPTANSIKQFAQLCREHRYDYLADFFTKGRVIPTAGDYSIFLVTSFEVCGIPITL